jgi:hypothetical protein
LDRLGPHELLAKHKQFKDSRNDDDLYFHWNGSTLSYDLKTMPEPTETSDDGRSDEVKEEPVSQTLTLTAMDVKEGGNKDSVPIPGLLEDVDLCSVTCACNCLEDTKDIRLSTSLYLFINATPPHQDLSRDKLPNWLAESL